jgi:hypothetical protein
MPKRYFWLTTFAVLGAALLCNGAVAQGIIPGTANLGEGESNNAFPYNVTSMPNAAYMQFVAPGEFCVNPPDQFNGGTTPGSGALEPALISGLSVRPDGPLASLFTATHTRPDAGSFHFLTDLQMNGNAIFFQDSLNWNATTVTYPGGWTLSFPTGASASIPGTQEFTPITSTAGVFTYLGSLTGCCGSCPAPAQGGMMINVRVTSGSGTGLLFADMVNRTATVGIHYNTIRLWGVGAGATGFNSWINFFAGLVYQLDVGGCKTYSDLFDEVSNAIITGNPPSAGTSFDPYDIGGLRNSYAKQALNSEAAFNRGRFNAAGNGLSAMDHHVSAQDGKHLDSDSASDLHNCIRSLKSSLGL